MSGKKKIKKEQKINDAVFKDTVDDFDRFEDFVQGNLNKIIATAIVFVIVLIIAYVVYSQIEEAKNKASAVLTSAKTIEELNTAIKKYPNSITDEPARLNLGTLYFKKGKYKEAIESYRKLAATAQPGDVKNRARLNEAYTLEAMKEPEKAADKFAMIALDAIAPGYIRNEANYSAARIFISLQKLARAKSSLKAIKSDNPNDFWASQAKRLMERLKAKDVVAIKPVVLTTPEQAIKPIKKATK